MMGAGLAQYATSRFQSYELRFAEHANRRFSQLKQRPPLVIGKYCQGTPL
jgi:hypothetical protein